LDGTDVRDLPLAGLRTAVGCAFEDATLFSASVRENVMFGAPDADDEAVEAALTAAQARFAFDLPWGLDTRVGEQGLALSGGQRQRIALARAILAAPDVLILDDPLSALDVHTEERVTRALHEILAGSTALVVAHRPSTVALADTVALLSGGVIAASGSHRELLASNPEYAALMDVAGLEESAGPRPRPIWRGRPPPQDRRGLGGPSPRGKSGAGLPRRRPTRSAPAWPRCCGTGAGGCSVI